jgi:hypothetical protein
VIISHGWHVRHGHQRVEDPGEAVPVELWWMIPFSPLRPPQRPSVLAGGGNASSCG